MTAIHAHADHAATRAGRHTRALVTTLALTMPSLVVEVAGAIWTGSLALLADAGHMLTDVGGLMLAHFAIGFAAKPPTPEKTYGFYGVEILAALANALVLMGISAYLIGARRVELVGFIRARFFRGVLVFTPWWYVRVSGGYLMGYREGIWGVYPGAHLSGI